jgi:hypothetical protein
MKYLPLLIAFIIVAILSVSGGKEKDSPDTPKLLTFCSMIHFLVGSLFAIFTPLSAIQFAILHICFELFENSKLGKNLFKSQTNILYKLSKSVKKLTKIDFWGDEGESYKGDSAINSNMDTLLAVIGFLIGRYCRDH